MISEGTRVPDPDEAFDLAHFTLDAHCNAYHGGVLDDGCPDCTLLEAHEARAAFLYGIAVDPLALSEMVA